MDSQGDKDYLKRYVESHPDNRMAWYLLGKQYVLEGKEGKANYCFLKAGSIYEAYERKRHPLAGPPKQMIAAWNRRRRLRSLVWRTSAASLLLMAALLSAPFARKAGEPGDNASHHAESTVERGDSLRVVVIKPVTNHTAAAALGALLRDGEQPPESGLAVMLEQDGSWRKWTGRTRMLLYVKAGGGGQTMDIRMLDAQTCACRPADDSEAARIYKSWARSREERWTLASGIAQYRELFDRLPESLGDLIRPYPNNVLAGQSAGMEKLFPELIRSFKASETGDNVAEGARQRGEVKSREGTAKPVSAATAAAAASGSEASLPDEPLSIVIDKGRHTLAVVSGDVIVRSYPVGLGGDKTPEGGFYISEKVKNPNGKDNGDFGSRGMVLSGTRYAIHGTNEPGSIGGDESHGCIRMRRDDIEELYDLVPLGTKVEIKSGVLPGADTPEEQRFKLQPMQDETNPAAVYRWLS